MKKFILISFFTIFYFENLLAETLSEALNQAYKNNPELNAERENIKVSEENLKISRSEFLPSVTLSGSKSEEDTEKLTDRSGNNSAITDVNPKTTSITVEQKLFQGLGGIADLQKNKIGLSLAKAELLKTEQEILFKAIEAYTGLILALEKLDINKNLTTAIITRDKEIVENSNKLSPAYLVFNNYELILKWNRSLRFALAVCTLKDKFSNEL